MSAFPDLHFTIEELVTEGYIVVGRLTVSPSPFVEGTRPVVPLIEVRGSSNLVGIFPMLNGRISENVLLAGVQTTISLQIDKRF
jgi:predicted ester cyclase